MNQGLVINSADPGQAVVNFPDRQFENIAPSVPHNMCAALIKPIGRITPTSIGNQPCHLIQPGQRSPRSHPEQTGSMPVEAQCRPQTGARLPLLCGFFRNLPFFVAPDRPGDGTTEGAAARACACRQANVSSGGDPARTSGAASRVTAQGPDRLGSTLGRALQASAVAGLSAESGGRPAARRSRRRQPRRAGSARSGRWARGGPCERTVSAGPPPAGR